MSNVKKKIIITAVVIGLLALLVGSFFLRDLALRAGFAEFERREIISMHTKYSATIDKVVKSSEQLSNFSITAKHGGLFEKATIVSDENGEKLMEEIKAEIDVLCHTYCFRIYKADNTVCFTFNESGSKMIAVSDTVPEKQNDKDTVEEMSDGCYYVEYFMG